VPGKHFVQKQAQSVHVGGGAGRQAAAAALEQLGSDIGRWGVGGQPGALEAIAHSARAQVEQQRARQAQAVEAHQDALRAKAQVQQPGSVHQRHRVGYGQRQPAGRLVPRLRIAQQRLAQRLAGGVAKDGVIEDAARRHHLAVRISRQRGLGVGWEQKRQRRVRRPAAACAPLQLGQKGGFAFQAFVAAGMRHLYQHRLAAAGDRALGGIHHAGAQYRYGAVDGDLTQDLARLEQQRLIIGSAERLLAPQATGRRPALAV